MVDILEYSPCERSKKTLLEKLHYFLQRKCTIGFLQNIFAQKTLTRARGTLTVNKAFFIIALGLVISLGAPASLVKANPGVHINVPQSPLSPGQPVYIEFWTDVGEDGTLQMDITKPPLLAIFWQSGPIQVTGGLLYDVTAPGFNDPGTYTVSASVNLAGGIIYGSTTFDVVQGGGGGGGQPGFDFNLEADPPVREVEQGETARFQMHVQYSNPSYGGTPINVNVTGLGQGMHWFTTPGGELVIETSPETPPGEYHIEIIGEAQGVERRTNVTLIVREHPEPEEPPPEYEPEPEEPPPEHEPEHEEPPPEYEEPPPEHEPEPEEPPQEEYRPSEPQPETWQPQPSGSTMDDLFSNPLYLVIIVLLIVVILLIIALMRK
jgi:hypothetical protein